MGVHNFAQLKAVPGLAWHIKDWIPKVVNVGSKFIGNVLFYMYIEMFAFPNTYYICIDSTSSTFASVATFYVLLQFI